MNDFLVRQNMDKNEYDNNIPKKLSKFFESLLKKLIVENLFL